MNASSTRGRDTPVSFATLETARYDPSDTFSVRSLSRLSFLGPNNVLTPPIATSTKLTTTPPNGDTLLMLRDRDCRTLAVFSHPNHEVAAYGLLQRLSPHLVFLTDGGGEERISQTKRGLDRLDLTRRASFLPHTEQSFYDAIRTRDHSLFWQVAGEVASLIQAVKPDQILCDAVEFYNPVHDIALPVTLAAITYAWTIYDAARSPVYEVPLIYETPAGQYRVQSAPPEFSSERTVIELTAPECAAKKEAFQTVYSILRDTLGPVLRADPTTIGREHFFTAQSPLRLPGPDCLLRYEHRARTLKQAGKIETEITHEHHFLPVVRGILGV